MSEVRHVGVWITEKGSQNVDTKKRCVKIRAAVRKLAKAWALGTKHGRGEGSKVLRSVRLHVVKSVVLPVATTFARSRAWRGKDLKMLQRAANYAVRRCMGMDRLNMQQYGISDKMMYQASQWDTMEDLVCRHTMQWLGHVARMPVWRRPKQIVFGWMTDMVTHKGTRGGTTVNTWYHNVVDRAQIEQIDWFRLAQDRKGWKRKVVQAFPTKKMDSAKRRVLDDWRPWKRMNGSGEGANEPRGVEENTMDSETEGVETSWTCTVCSQTFRAANMLKEHYDSNHSIRDPDLVTTVMYQCKYCKKYLAREKDLRSHDCPARKRERQRQEMTVDNWWPVRQQPEGPPPAYWHIATDGSGQTKWAEGSKVCVAGWGVVIFRGPVESMEPNFVLHAPVVVEEWDHLWIGAREKTNNTAELSAIGEAMLWLLEEAPDGGDRPAEIRFDSYYAANIAQGIWEPKSNEELAKRVKKLVERVCTRRHIEWTHVYGHTRAHDNEMADRAADMGAKGRVSEHSKRWAAPPPVEAGENDVKMDICRKCGIELPVSGPNIIKWHVRHCNVPERRWVVPKGKDQCRKCKALVTIGARPKHEERCRESTEANRTCSKCGQTGFPIESTGLSRAMRIHENQCKGEGSYYKGRTMEYRDEQHERSRARAKSKARAKAKTLGKGSSKGGKGRNKGKGNGRERGRGRVIRFGRGGRGRRG